MKKAYYLFNPGRLSRKDNTLKFTPVDADNREGKPRYLPVETIETLYCFGSLDANSALYNFMGKNGITIHFFDYYEHYTGSFYPKDYLLSGRVHVNQALLYADPYKRVTLAKKVIEGAAFNMLKNLRYYQNRGRELSAHVTEVESWQNEITRAEAIDELMGIEGNIRNEYYKAFDEIINDFNMDGRSRQPPQNEINTLISFGNMMCYSSCMDAIYHTQLNPTISFLHEPGERRYSLALDLAEIFKPLLVDRTVFTVLNKKIVQQKDFKQELNRCVMKDSARKSFVKAYEERLAETIKHRTLKKNVSYKYLLRLECYKLVKHMMGIEYYVPFKAWW